MNRNKAFYTDLVRTVNRILGRRALSVERIVRTVDEAKRIRQNRGALVLVQYLTSLSERLFTPAEVEKLKRSPKKREYTDRMLDLMVHEQVVSPTEARMLKRMV
ncbi:KaiC/GvpD/RAD55 family RecA-like ATPase [Kroppenstedtia sanguinis]|uniref:Uncharacterized protein n=1 Tax=Kroppenstedtia sanguinis TaxID=1380684 RepID=A0ABW4C7A5_9BACL